MSKITPNRQGLKDLADLSIDVQFCQQYGSQIFNYNGESTPEYEQLVESFKVLLEDLLQDVKNVQSQLTAND